MTERMTNEEYVLTDGLICPKCRSRQVTGGFVEIDSGVASQPVDCLDCGAEWVDVYTLTGYQDLK